MQALPLDRLRGVPARLREVGVRLRAHPRLAWAAGAGVLALAVPLASALRPDVELDGIPTARVQRGDVRVTLVESGELRAEQQATVSATNDKQIVWLVPEGTRVKQGELLIRFEANKYEIAKSAAESALAVARADLAKAQGQLEAQKVAQEKARLQYESLPELAERGFVTRNELDAARLAHEEVRAGTRSFEAGVEAARANVQRAESEVDQQNRKLDEGLVHAPRDGVVVYATTGEATNPRKISVGMTPFEGMELLYLPDPSSMRVDTEVTEFDVAKVHEGAPVELRLDAYPDAVFHGEVSKVSALARQKVSKVSGQAIGVKVFDVGIRVVDQDERLKPGLSATVQVLVSENPGVLYVPVAGVFVDELEQTVVYVKAGGHAEKRAVVLGGSTDRVAIVASGVEEGAEILLDAPQPT